MYTFYTLFFFKWSRVYTFELFFYVVIIYIGSIFVLCESYALKHNPTMCLRYSVCIVISQIDSGTQPHL